MLLAEHDRHFEIHLVGVNAVFRLTDNNLAANAACEVKRGQAGVNFLLRERVRFAMQIDKASVYFQSRKAVSTPQRR